MRVLAIWIGLAGCSFTHGTAADPGGGGGGGASGPDATSVVRPACDLSDPSVQLCLDFDAPVLGLDSSLGQHDATVTNATAMWRASEQAVMVDTSSMIRVAPTTALDLTNHITFELWVDPLQLPATSYNGLDNTGQYSISLLASGLVQCAIGSAQATSQDTVPLGAWSHVGCTYDGTKLDIYIDGVASTCQDLSETQIQTTSSTGTTIGAPFVGGLDNVHVLSRAVTHQEMCTHAGLSGCSGGCASD
ncbi:MAG: LamG-like jellyroll fold domain-containing protein [Acidobacteriota bacterium]